MNCTRDPLYKFQYNTGLKYVTYEHRNKYQRKVIWWHYFWWEIDSFETFRFRHLDSDNLDLIQLLTYKLELYKIWISTKLLFGAFSKIFTAAFSPKTFRCQLLNKVQNKTSPWIQNVHWTCKSRSEEVLDVFWTSYVCSVYLLYLGGTS